MSGDVMMFPDTVEEFMEQYKVVDREQVYSNGIEFVPIFRMQQWFDHVKHSPDDVRGVGKWIWHDNYGWDDSLECSCCAEEFVVYDGEFPGIDSFKFCPSCGARMKGAEDGTTE